MHLLTVKFFVVKKLQPFESSCFSKIEVFPGSDKVVGREDVKR